MGCMTYLNEYDPFAAQWCRNLADAGEIPPTTIDERSIVDVQPENVEGLTQCHWFAGIAGWPLALKLAGWPADREIWTASLPCQPFSVAGQQKGEEDERHLWPEFIRILRGQKRRPCTIVGEQVPAAIGLGWLDGVFVDLEGEGYTCGAVVLPACSVGSPHIRQRIFWMAHASSAERRRGSESERQHGRTLHAANGDWIGPVAHADSPRRKKAVRGRRIDERNEPEPRCDAVSTVADTDGQRHDGRQNSAKPRRKSKPKQVEAGGTTCTVADTKSRGLASGGSTSGSARHIGECGEVGRMGYAESDNEQRDSMPRAHGQGESSGGSSGPWSDTYLVQCSDDKQRRVGAGLSPLAYGLPHKMVRVVAALESLGYGAKEIKRIVRRPRSLLALASRNRVGRLKGYGNAIVAPLAAVFVRAVMEILGTK